MLLVITGALTTLVLLPTVCALAKADSAFVLEAAVTFDASVGATVETLLVSLAVTGVAPLVSPAAAAGLAASPPPLSDFVSPLNGYHGPIFNGSSLNGILMETPGILNSLKNPITFYRV